MGFVSVSVALFISAASIAAYAPPSICRDKQPNEPFYHNGAYVVCVLVNGELHLADPKGCADPAGGPPVPIGKAHPKTGAICVQGKNAPFFATGSVKECLAKRNNEFVEGDVYKKCVLVKNHYSKKVVACFRFLSAVEQAVGNFSNRIAIGQSVIANVGGKSTKYTCLAHENTARLVTEVHSECEKRKSNEQFMINKSLKKCIVKNNKLESVPQFCLYPLSSLSDIEVVDRVYNDPKTKKPYAQIAIGKTFEGEHLSKPVTGKCVVSSGEAVLTIGDYVKCKAKGSDEFLEANLYKRCRIVDGVYTAEAIACHINWARYPDFVDYNVNRIELNADANFQNGRQKLTLTCTRLGSLMDVYQVTKIN